MRIVAAIYRAFCKNERALSVKRTFTPVFCISLFICFSLTSRIALGEVDKIKDQTLAGIKARWKAYEQLTLDSKGKVTQENKWVAPSEYADRPPSETEYNYKYSNGNGLRQIVSFSRGKRSESLHAYNSDYSFYLNRTLEKDPWAKIRVEKADGAPHDLADRGLGIARNCFYIESQYLPKLIDDPAFIIDSIDKNPQKQSIQIKFHCGIIDAVNQDWWVKDGVIEISLNGYNLPQEYFVSCMHEEKQFTIVRKIEYSKKDTRIIKTIKETTSRGAIETLEFSDVEFAKLPAMEFRLEAFGLKYTPGDLKK